MGCPEGLSGAKDSNGPLLFLLVWSENNVLCGLKQVLEMPDCGTGVME